MLLQHLTYLTALARERHFGRAAEACHVSQATLSAAIRRLEAELGVPLVQRGHRFEGLTPEGERALAWAHRILTADDGMRRDLQAMKHGLSGRARIGAIPTSLPVVSLLTNPLRARHAKLTVSIRSLTSREIERGLDESQLDVGLTYLENEPLDGVRSLPLYDERYLFIAPSTGPYADAKTVSWAEAARAPLALLSSDMQNRRTVDRLFQQAGAVPLPQLETNSISTLYAHVVDGSMCTVIPHAWLRLFPLAPGLCAVPLTEPEARQSIGLVWLDRDPEPLVTQAIVATARALDLDEQLRGVGAEVSGGASDR